MLVYAVVALLSILVSVLFFRRRQTSITLLKDHFLITGGSRGIGKAFAEEVVRRGASVTLLARNKERLEDVKSKLMLDVIHEEQKILVFPLDVSIDSQELKDIIKQAENQLGPITYLVNVAGTSICHRFEETPKGEFERMLRTNVLGSVYITQVVVPLMKERRKGNIIYFSSLAGVVGLYGYSAYSASKFAVIGMAQSLAMEVSPYGIGVTVSLPPDTDTPGYTEEVKVKLPETQLLCETGGIFSPNDVAKKALNDSLNKKFLSSLGFEGWCLCLLGSCTSKVSSYFDLFIQVCLLGILRLVMFWYAVDSEKKLAKFMKMRQQ